MKINIFWFRRDLSLEDNHGLYKALTSGLPVLPIFIFDSNITNNFNSNDSRISFIYEKIKEINNKFKDFNSSFLILKDKPLIAFQKLCSDYDISAVYTNEDYEPYAIKRDFEIEKYLAEIDIKFYKFKNQVIFAKNEIVKSDLKPYTVYTPYKNAWLRKYAENLQSFYPSESQLFNLHKSDFHFPSIEEIGFSCGKYKVKAFRNENIENYHLTRNFPSKDSGTYLGPHLRFGTISIRKIVRDYINTNETFISELIWREFFMQILYHFPYIENSCFRKKYDSLKWRNNEKEFEKWCEGKTGYPIVDAGMIELNTTGYMHNRIRMITASFLVKHLLIDWQWGEAYFAEKLLDYELSSNNGNWQWAASTGCDAVPYFRIFNPNTQQIRFDKDYLYVKQHIIDFSVDNFISPIVKHEDSRIRAINTWKNIELNSNN